MVNVAPLATISLISTLLGVGFATGRLYLRWIKLRIWRWDDAFLYAALITSLGGYVVIAWMTYGSLLHARPEPKYRRESNYPYYWKYLAQTEAAIAVYTLQAMFSRLSLIFSYRGFSPYSRFRTQRRAVNISGIICFVIGMLFTYGTLFPCSPPKFMHYPNTWINHKTTFCLAPREIFWWSFCFNIACDVLVWALPFWLLLKYREELMERYQRWGLFGLYTLGALIILLGASRIPAYWPLRAHKGSVGGLSVVSLYRQMGVWILTIVQANLYLIAASTPTLRRLFPRFRPEDPYAEGNYSEHLPNINNSAIINNSSNVNHQDGSSHFVTLGRDFDDDSFRQSTRNEMQQRHMILKSSSNPSRTNSQRYNSYGSRASRNASTTNSISGVSGKSALGGGGSIATTTGDEYDIYDRGKSDSPDQKDDRGEYFELEHLTLPTPAKGGRGGGSLDRGTLRSDASTEGLTGKKDVDAVGKAV